MRKFTVLIGGTTTIPNLRESVLTDSGNITI